jgi:hypothetical protein
LKDVEVMTFDEACELARVINGNPRFAVIAVGRFALQTELQTAYRTAVADKLPWGVSVMCVDDVDDRSILRRESDWREFAANRQRSATPKPNEPIAPKPIPKPKQPELELY